jgi:peptidoglycan/LPS O-acetylase OafA/YrhL
LEQYVGFMETAHSSASLSKLDALCVGRDNNLNLIRMLAAYAVLISHAYVLSAGTSDAEPGNELIGMSIGAIAVHVFFLASGFLVTGSLITRCSLIEYAWARALRIVPGLIVMLVLVVLVVGPIFTRLPLDRYLSDARTWEYLVRNAFPVVRAAFELPGVFEQNPIKASVNGSLWTLPYEVRMYIVLALLWVCASWWRGPRERMFVPLIFIGLLTTGGHVLASHFARAAVSEWSALGFMFFCGASFYVCRRRVRLVWPGLLGVVSTWALTLAHPALFFPVYLLTLGYVVLFLAYVPNGVLRRYNELGDFSYGMYIYAFPVQQALVACIPGASPATIIASSTVVTVVLAIVSWHLVEKRSLAVKGRAVQLTRRWLGQTGEATSVDAKPTTTGPSRSKI